MKTKTYPKIIIHRIGGHPPVSRRRAQKWFWLTLVLGLLGVAQFSHAASHTWSGAGANTNWSPNLVLVGANAFNVGNSIIMIQRGAISGTGGITKKGSLRKAHS